MFNAHQQAGFTVRELIATIERSSLVTVLVEGRDDMSIYDSFNAFGGKVSIVQTQGRCTLLMTYIKAKEKGLLDRCVFIADSDSWIFEGVPIGYEDVLFTTGYSIENDIVAGCRMIKNLLRDRGQSVFESGKYLLSRWFAFYLEQHIAHKPAKADVKPLELLDKKDNGEFVERVGALEKVGFQNPSEELIRDIETHFEIKFRGKNLVDYICASFVSAHNIDARIEQYNHNQIINIAVNAETPSSYLAKLKNKLKERLSHMDCEI